MKKFIVVLMATLMLTGMLSMLFVPVSAEGEDVAEEEPVEKKEYVMYISDNGDDSNDGLTDATPMKTWKKLMEKMNAAVKDEYDRGKVVVVDVTSADPNGKALETISPKWTYPLTITSASKETAKFVLNGTFRLMGETLITNLKIVGTKAKVLYADAYNVTFGLAGVEDDVVCEGDVSISIGFPSDTQIQKRDFTCTINSGTYANVYGEGKWGHQLDGSAKLVINGGTFANGVISMGGDYQFSGKNGFFSCTGDYMVQINGGTFNNQIISIGWTNRGSEAYSKNTFGGKVTLDINGGTFTGCNGKIGKGSTLDPESCLPESLNFNGGVEVNIGDIPFANKATYKALVAEADQNLVVEHNYDILEQIAGNDESHKAKCDCGCDSSIDVAHIYDEGTVTKTATHLVDGNIKYICEACGYEKNVPITADPNNHLYAGAAWENHDSEQHKRKCTDPDCTHYEYENHTWDEGIITTPATHTEEGVKTFTCTGCGATKTEAVAKTDGHSMGNWEKYDENQHKRSCACGETKYADHSWDDGVITKEATQTEDGEKTYTCRICSATKTEVIAKLGSDEKEQTSGCGSSLSTGFALCLAVALGGSCMIYQKRKKK